jgi:hypothetical protein
MGYGELGVREVPQTGRIRVRVACFPLIEQPSGFAEEIDARHCQYRFLGTPSRATWRHIFSECCHSFGVATQPFHNPRPSTTSLSTSVTVTLAPNAVESAALKNAATTAAEIYSCICVPQSCCSLVTRGCDKFLVPTPVMGDEFLGHIFVVTKRLRTPRNQPGIYPAASAVRAGTRPALAIDDEAFLDYLLFDLFISNILRS